MKTISDTLPLAASFLKSRRDAEEIFCFVLGMKRIDLYMHYDRPLLDEELEKVRILMKRASKGEPLVYLFGEVDFYHCSLTITRDVLIPRPETELLVDLIVKKLKGKALAGKEFWDLCTGSGCIGLALKQAYPELRVTLSDLSLSALKLAKENARKNQLDVELLEGDLLQPFRDRKIDFLVCNPPYISEKEYDSLDESVRLYEPKQALIGGESGLEFYERLARELPPFLQPGSTLFFELGANQGEQIKKIFNGEIIKDYAGHDRFFFLEIE